MPPGSVPVRPSALAEPRGVCRRIKPLTLDCQLSRVAQPSLSQPVLPVRPSAQVQTRGNSKLEARRFELWSR
jgi:hypothetical protein